MQYFGMTSAIPGGLFVKTASDAEEKHISILRVRDVLFDRDMIPSVIPTSDLSWQRQEYIYSTVRQYVVYATRMPPVYIPIHRQFIIYHDVH